MSGVGGVGWGMERGEGDVEKEGAVGDPECFQIGEWGFGRWGVGMCSREVTGNECRVSAAVWC
jgi:hypothetical protein